MRKNAAHMLTLKTNKKPTMAVCKMQCDKPLDPKLNKYDMTSCFNCHQSTLVVGKPGSGKTNLMYSFLKSKELLRKVYDKIFVFQPSKSRESMEDDIFAMIPDDQRYDELTLENLEACIDSLEPDGCNMIVFDDMTAYLKDNEIQKRLREIMYNRRHMHVSIFMLVQTYKSVPPPIRKNMNNIILFKCSRAEMQDVFNELMDTRKDHVDSLIRFVFKKPHDYMFCHVETQRMWRNFDEILYKDILE